MLTAVLDHALGDLIVHVLLNAIGSFLFLLGDLAQNFCSHRASGWERLRHSLGLEPNSRLGQHG